MFLNFTVMKYLSVFILSFIFQSLQQVEIYGSLGEIMHNGDVSGKVRLNLLGPLENRYGVGAVAGLDGEILIYEGEVFVTRYDDNLLSLDKSSDVEAALLAITRVPEWQEIEVTMNLDDHKAVESFVAKMLSEKGINSDGAVPFKLSTENGYVNWHIIRPPEKGKDHKDAAKRGKYNGSFNTFGIYSTHHEGIITHKGSNAHIHFINEDKTLAAHVDEIAIPAGSRSGAS